MSFPVEKGIRIPPADTGSKNATYPFADMQAKDSFLVPLDTEDAAAVKKATSRLNSAMYAYKKKHGGKFCMRTMKGKGIRVWRLE